MCYSSDRAHGVFLVTNFWDKDTDELKQATAALRADAGVKHFISSTLPDVEAISSGKFKVSHFTGKAGIAHIVKDAGFAHPPFVSAPFSPHNLGGHVALRI